MSDKSYSADDLKKLEEYAEMQDKASSNLDNYLELMKKIKLMKSNINFLDSKSLNYQKKIDKLVKDDANANKDKIDSLIAQKKLATDRSKLLKEEAKTLAIVLNNSSKLNAVLGTTVDVMGSITNSILSQSKYLLEQQKSVKMSQLQMGILSNEAKGFSDNLYNASVNTNLIGVDTKSLTKMQSRYSSEIGRAVILTQSGNEAMAELAQGTILGNENAAQFAASMDEFNYSVEASRDFMEESMNLSHTMGLNSISVTENLKKSLKIAQTYNFKGGVKGIKEMANLATKFKLELQSVSGFADKVFNPEGAIEMASKLSVLGGQWANLGDPFKLMYKARTDMAGLTEEITKAASSTAQFNSETGEFDIASMELHRLREIAKVTGITFDELTTSARQAAKFDKIKTEITGSFDPEIRDFIASRGVFDNKNKEFKINLNGSDYFIKNLNQFTNTQLSTIAKQQESLNERARQSKTFDETFENIINQFKSVLLPGFQTFSNALSTGLYDFTDWAKNNHVFEHLQDVGRWVGGFSASVIKLIANNPITAGIGYLLGKTAIWVARGRMLGLGFNSVATSANASGTTANGVGGKMSRGMGIGAGLGLLGVGVSALADQYTEEGSDNNKYAKDFGSVLSYAGTGAMLGSMVPVVGTAAGGIIGAGIGTYMAMQDGDETQPSNTQNGNMYLPSNKTHNDFVARPGQDPISFSSADTLIGMKKGGGIDNAVTKENKKSGNGSVSVNFNKPLKIEGSINVSSGSSSFKMDLNDPLVMREISKLVQQEISTSLNGKRSEIPVN